MERKISSSLTEFFKLYGVLCIILFFSVFGWSVFDFSDPVISFLLLGVLVFCIFFVVDSWRLKEIELTDEEIIITSRFFFNQKITFVHFEDIKEIKNRFKWLGNHGHFSIEFDVDTEFGHKINFLAKGFTPWSQAENVKNLKQAIIQNKDAERLSSASSN